MSDNPTYNLKDPADAQRFAINLMLGDIGGEMADHAPYIGRNVIEPHVVAALQDFVVALERLNEVTAPKALDTDLKTQTKLLLQPVTVCGSMHDCGDGSVSIHWFMTEEEATYDQEHLSQGWGEPCTETVQTYEGSKVWFEALDNSREQRQERKTK